jgi:hypothetical protein
VDRGALTRTFALVLLLLPAPLAAQTVEIGPLLGYRAGDFASAATTGVVVAVTLWPGFQVDGLFSHQSSSGVAVDHWLAGALQEFGGGSVRPFLAGDFGLTRYGFVGDDEIRFTTSGGGGVKVFPVSRVGVRLDGRVFATFLDATTAGSICGGAGCLVRLHLDVAWQVEVSAAVIVRFGRL